MAAPLFTRVDATTPVTAPDGSRLWPLLRVSGGSLSRFELAAGATSAAVLHRSVDELWYCIAGRGEIWRRDAGGESITELLPDSCVAVVAGTAFQFRALGSEILAIVAVTLPPWPGDAEARPADGPWTPSPPAG